MFGAVPHLARTLAELGACQALCFRTLSGCNVEELGAGSTEEKEGQRESLMLLKAPKSGLLTFSAIPELATRGRCESASCGGPRRCQALRLTQLCMWFVSANVLEPVWLLHVHIHYCALCCVYAGCVHVYLGCVDLHGCERGAGTVQRPVNEHMQECT